VHRPGYSAGYSTLGGGAGGGVTDHGALTGLADDDHTQYALKASPAFTGTPTAPTPTEGDNDTSIATTAFVATALGAVGGVRDYAEAVKSNGSYTLGSTSWANVDTALDLVLDAAAGDLVMAGLVSRTSNQAVELNLDVVTVVSGSPVNSMGLRTSAPTGSTLEGLIYCTSGVYQAINGGGTMTLGSGDISAGTVRLRLRYRAAGSSRTLLADSAARPLVFWAVTIPLA
jgi:hypothetical protein